MIDDPVSETRLKLVFKDLADRWTHVRDEYWEINELQLRVTQGFRSYPEQWAFYAEGRKRDAKGNWIVFDKKKIVTHAKGGESFHNFGLALDSAFMGDDPYLDKMSGDDSTFLWTEYGRICEKHGLLWGGSWKSSDRPHAERTYGLSLSVLQMVYEEFGIEGVFNKCSQIMSCGKEALV